MGIIHPLLTCHTQLNSFIVYSKAFFFFKQAHAASFIQVNNNRSIPDSSVYDGRAVAVAAFTEAYKPAVL